MLAVCCCMDFSLIVSGGLLSSCGVQAYHCDGFFCVARALGHVDFGSLVPGL